MAWVGGLGSGIFFGLEITYIFRTKTLNVSDKKMWCGSFWLYLSKKQLEGFFFFGGG